MAADYEFDADNYFKNKIQEDVDLSKAYSEPLRTEYTYPRDTDDELSKLGAIRGYAASIPERVAKESETYSKTLAGQIGLDSDGVTHDFVNLVANFVSGTAREVGRLATIAPGTVAVVDDALVDQNDRDAYNRLVMGKATDDDVKLLDTPRIKTMGDASFHNEAFGVNEPDETFTPREVFSQARQARNLSKSITDLTDYKHIVDQKYRQKLIADIGDGFDRHWDQIEKGYANTSIGNTNGLGEIAVGTAKLILSSAGAIADNKLGILEFIVENAPQLIMGKVLGHTPMAVSNLGYATEYYQKGVDAHQKAHNGQLPDSDELSKIALLSASLAAAEHWSAVTQLGAMKKAVTAIKAPFKKAATTTAAEAAKTATNTTAATATEAAKKSLFQSLRTTDSALLNTAKAGIQGMGTEGVTEFYQTGAEGILEKDFSWDQIKAGDPKALKEMFTGGVIGTASGGALTGGGRAVAEITGSTPEKINKKIEELKNDKAKNTVIKQAADTGDVSTLVDPASPHYAPDSAILALAAHSSLEGATEEVITNSFNKAVEITEKLREEATLLNEAKTASETKLSETTNELAELSNLLKITPKQDPNHAVITEGITTLKDTQKLLVTQIKEQTAKTALSTRQLDASEKTLNYFKVNSFDRSLDINEVAEVANNTVDTTDIEATTANTKAINDVISLSMAIPERLDPAKAEKLATNTSNHLKPEQREYLQAFANARRSENSLKDMSEVNSDVLGTNPKSEHLGILQYRKQIGESLQAGNLTVATAKLAGLAKFAKTHSSKAEVMASTWDDGRGKGKTILRNASGLWSTTTPLTTKEEKKAGSLTGVMSLKLVQTTQTEAEALRLAVKEAETAIIAKFGKGALNKSNTVSDNTPVNSGKSSTNLTPVKPAVENKQQKGKSPKTAFTDKAMTGTVDTDIGKNKAKIEDTKTKTDVQSSPATNSPPIYNISTNKNVEGETRPEINSEPIKGETTQTPSKTNLNTKPKTKPETLSDDEINALLADAASEVDEASYELFDDNPDTVVASPAASTPVAPDVAKSDASASATPSTPVTSITPTAAVSQATEQQAAATAEAQAAEVAAKQEEEPGKLSVYAINTPKNTKYNNQNLIATQTIQRQGKKGSATFRPLVVTKNFVSKVKENFQTVHEFIAGKSLSVNQVKAIQHFVDTAHDWFGLIQKNLSKTNNKNFQYRDMMQYFLQDTDNGVDIEENVKAAIAMAAYGYVIDEASFGQYATNKDINNLLGRPEYTPISKLEYSLFSERRVNQNTLRNNLGKKVVQALGISPKEDAPLDIIPRLESAFGAHAQRILEQVGLIKSLTLNVETVNTLRNEFDADTFSKFASVTFLGLNYENNKLNPLGRSIVEASKGSQRILNKLFSVEANLKNPTTKPVPFTQEFASSTRRKVGTFLRTVLEQKNKEPNKIDVAKHRLLSKLGLEQTAILAGAVEVNEANTHIDDLHGAQAKSDAIKRDVERYFNYTSSELEGEGNPGILSNIYLRYVVWSNQRVGIDTNGVDPLGNTFHRFMLYKPEWVSKVTLNDKGSLDNFKLRVLEGLGYKTEVRTNSVTLDGANSIWNTMFDEQSAIPEVAEKAAKLNAAIWALIESDTFPEGELIPDDIVQTIQEGVAAGGETMHTLDVLMAMASYRSAELEGKESFDTHMAAFVDGVSNGPILNHIFYAAANGIKGMFERANKGGFYQLGDKHTHYGSYRGTAGNYDLYETTSLVMIDAARDIIKQDPSTAQTFRVIQNFTGNLIDRSDNGMTPTKAGRDMSKDMINPINFGSGIVKAAATMSNTFMDLVRRRITKAVQANPEDQKQLAKDIQNDMNHLISLHAPNAIVRGNPTVQKLLRTRITETQETAIKRAFMDTLGKAAQTALKSEFSDFLVKRDKFVKASNLAFDIYNAVYQAIREDYISKLDLPRNSANQPIRDLTQTEEDVLRNRIKRMKPLMHTAMSKKDNELDSGILLAKTHVGTNSDPVYESEIRFAAPGGKTTTTKGRGAVYQEESIGVGGVAAGTHSSDSNISHAAQFMEQLLNIHDAVGTGLNNFHEIGQKINKATWDTLIDYSPLIEVYNTLERVINATAALANSNDLTPLAVENLSEVISKLVIPYKSTLASALSYFMADLKYTVAESSQLTYEFLSELAVIDQYAMEGGSYFVTDAEDRAIAKSKADTVEFNLSNKLIKSIGTISKIIGQTKQIKDTPTTSPNVLVDTGISQVNEELANLPTDKLLTLLGHYIDFAGTSELRKSQLETLYNHITQKGGNIYEAVDNFFPDTVAKSITRTIEGVFNKVNPDIWGGLGQPYTAPNKGLEAELQATPVVSGKQALQIVANHLGKDGSLPSRQFYRNLINQLVTLIPDTVKVHYVTANSLPQDIKGRKQTAARGWYTNTADGDIYILSSEFNNSSLVAETLIHELLHAALFSIVQNAKEGSPEAKLVNELKALQKKAEVFLANKGNETLQTKYAAAMGDVHEFIAWGMSNAGFQQDVLMSITMKSKTRTESLITGMQEFINKLVGLIFKKSGKTNQAHTHNGMRILIQNVSGLMASAAAVHNATIEQTLSMAIDPTIEEKINNYSTQDILNALVTEDAESSFDVSPIFSNHLTNVLNNIVEKLHGPYGSFKEALMENAVGSPIDVMYKALDTGVAPFASNVKHSGLLVSNQELFVIDQVDAVMTTLLDNDSITVRGAYKDLATLYADTYARLEAKDFFEGDWDTATQEQQQQAIDTYEFIFDIQTMQNPKHDYLSRFAAMGIGHEQFNKLLKVATVRSNKEIKNKNSFWGRLETIFNAVLRLFHDKYTNTYDGQPADEMLVAVVSKLVDIEAKRKHTLGQTARFNIIDMGEDLVKDAFDISIDKLKAIAESNFVRNSKSNLVSAAGGVARTVLGGRTAQVLELFFQMRDNEIQGRQGWLMGLLREIPGADKVDELLKTVEDERQKKRNDIRTNISKAILSGFENNGKSLSKKTSIAITAVAVRTGMHNLLQDFTLGQIQELLNVDGKALTAAIEKYVKQLPTQANINHFVIQQTMGLGHEIAVGGGKLKTQLLNAHAIAHYATELSNTSQKDNLQKDIEAIAKVLITLYGIQHTTAESKAALAKIMASEAARSGEDNGIDMVLKVHKSFETTSLETLFDDNPMAMQHGYTAEIYNPYTAVEVSSLAAGEELVDRGFKMGKKALGKDAVDPDSAHKYIFTMANGVVNERVSGAISQTGQRAAGTQTRSGTNPITGEFTEVDLNVIRKHKIAALREMFKAPGKNGYPDLTKSEDTHLIPILAPDGSMSGFRYMMQEHVKDILLDRNNLVHQVLGTHASSIFDKVSTKETNTQAITALLVKYESEFELKSRAYVEISPTSKDPEMRDIWNNLSKSAKQDVRKIWGEDKLWVHRNSIDIIFGYQEYSLTQMFYKTDGERKAIERFAVNAVEGFLTTYARVRLGKTSDESKRYAKRAAMLIARGERGWQEVVREIKDIIVIRTGGVLLANEFSNMSILFFNKVPLVQGLAWRAEAAKAALDWQNDTAELTKLEMQQNAGYTQSEGKQISRRIIELKNSLARNPAKELIEGGVMPTIVEDLAENVDIYSYKKSIVDKVDKATEKLPPLMKTVGKNVLMTRDTWMYDKLYKATQLSDFTSRYALYKHLTTKKHKPMSHMDALTQAMDSFINYNIPLQRTLNYLDRMGITMFTKYFLRIQKVLFQLMRDQPGRVVSSLLLGQLIDTGPQVFENHLMQGIGNPLRTGIFQLPSAIKSLATVSSSLALIK